MLPPDAAPTIIFPVVFNVPDTFTPVPVTTTTLALPTALIFTFPLAAGMFTLLFPLLRTDVPIVANDRLPEPSV